MGQSIKAHSSQFLIVVDLSTCVPGKAGHLGTAKIVSEPLVVILLKKTAIS